MTENGRPVVDVVGVPRLILTITLLAAHRGGGWRTASVVPAAAAEVEAEELKEDILMPIGDRGRWRVKKARGFVGRDGVMG